MLMHCLVEENAGDGSTDAGSDGSSTERWSNEWKLTRCIKSVGKLVI